MSTQRAIVAIAPPKPATVITRPIPQPGPKQIQLRVTIAALNPHDQKIRDHGLFMKGDNVPVVFASDVAGVVTALGSEVTRFEVGDRVFYGPLMASPFDQLGLQEYTVADEDFAAKVPDGITDHDTVTTPTNLTTGVISLFESTGGLGIPAPWTEEAKTFDYANTTLLIMGGGSNCGRFAVQLAKLAGIGKIVVVGGDEYQLKTFGATHVIDRHGGHDVVLARIRDIVSDELLYAYDTVNRVEDQHLAINALSNSQKGTCCRLIRSSGSPDESKIHQKQSGYVLKDGFGAPHVWPGLCKPFWGQVAGLLKDGKIVPNRYEVVEGLDVDKVNEVLDRYRDGKPVTQTHFRISK